MGEADRALTIITGQLFGPWDGDNFAARWLYDLEGARKLFVPNETIATTYLPDLMHVALDLLIDGESGVWHLFNPEPVSSRAFAEMLADAAGLRARISGAGALPQAQPARLRGPQLMPSLAHAMARFAREAERLPGRRRYLVAAE